ncbi:uncharacterized protein LOC131195101 [Ahaetulla prasina]|uniref:uncharacterized protein LOC131195101 n=1 Tax=Ahaetulla prasina TaxID=499056 RepID=UPI002649B62D|nr:uncharacterized protein LOC131195101 [Ahaetulla prasina]
MKPWILLLLAGLLMLSTQLASAKTTKQLCSPKVKVGECPKVKIPPDYPCHQKCTCDSDCEEDKKCCPVGCARECFPPGPLCRGALQDMIREQGGPKEEIEAPAVSQVDLRSHLHGHHLDLFDQSFCPADAKTVASLAVPTTWMSKIKDCGPEKKSFLPSTHLGFSTHQESFCLSGVHLIQVTFTNSLAILAIAQELRAACSPGARLLPPLPSALPPLCQPHLGELKAWPEAGRIPQLSSDTATMTPRRGSCPLLLFSLVGLLTTCAQEPDSAGQNTTEVAEKAGTCPQAELEVPNGNCTEECQSDARCEGNQKCCRTGCGTSCQIPDGAVIYVKDPCRPYKPTPGRSELTHLGWLRKQLFRDSCNLLKLHKTLKMIKFRMLVKGKAGSCPNVDMPIPPLGLCTNTCSMDSQCPSNKKCCRNGCGYMTCSTPRP